MDSAPSGHSPTSNEWMTIRDVERATHLHRASIYRKIADGTFAPPVKMSIRKSLWPAAEVNAWISARIAERGRAA